MAVETGFPSARKKGCFQGPVMDQQKQQVQSIMGNSLAAHGETHSLFIYKLKIPPMACILGMAVSCPDVAQEAKKL